jgi:hypothetical protein
VAPKIGIEPITSVLTGLCSTIELLRIGVGSWNCTSTFLVMSEMRRLLLPTDMVETVRIELTKTAYHTAVIPFYHVSKKKPLW